MADPNEDNAVPVIFESSWNVLQGSLESNLTVVFVDPSTKEPIIPAAQTTPTEKLVLKPSSESQPCQITVKFQGRLCNVESLYILSTSRICELYSQSKYEDDQDYICTVKGWISQPGDELEEAPSEDCSSFSENGDLKTQESLDMSKEEQITITKRPSIEVSDAQCLQNSSMSSDLPDGLERSVDSCEDSWVDVKLTSLSSESDIHIAGTSNTSSIGNCQSNTVQELKSNDLTSCASSTGNIEKYTGAEQEMYEAELELVDQNPWATFTIRLLSLQDKNRVEIDQIVLLVAPGPPMPKNEDRGGTNGNSSLLAMFLPSMLQMAKGLSLSKIEEQAGRKDPEFLSGSNLTNKEHCKSNSSAFLPVSENVESSNFIKEDPLMVSFNADTHGNCSVSGTDSKLKLEEVEKSNKQENVKKNLEMHAESRKELPRSGETPLSNSGCPSGEVLSGPLATNLLNTLQNFTERFDRLERLCMRMESYLEKTVERMDQRITLLEASYSKDSAAIYPPSELEKKSPTIMHPENEDHTIKEPCHSDSPVSAKSEGNTRADRLANVLVHDFNPVFDLTSCEDPEKPRNEPNFVSDHVIPENRSHVIKDVDFDIFGSQEIKDVDFDSLSSENVSRHASLSEEATAGALKLGKPCGSLDAAAWMMLSAFTCSFKADTTIKDNEKNSDLMERNQPYIPPTGTIVECKNENKFELETPRIEIQSEFDSGQANESHSLQNSSDSIGSGNNTCPQSDGPTNISAFSSSGSMESENNAGPLQSDTAAKISFYSSDSMCSVSSAGPQFDVTTKFFSSYSSDSMGSETNMSQFDVTTKVISSYSSYSVQSETKAGSHFDVTTKEFSKEERVDNASSLDLLREMDEKTECKVVPGTFSETVAETYHPSKDLLDAGYPVGKELGSVQESHSPGNMKGYSLRSPLFDLDSNDLVSNAVDLQPPLVDLEINDLSNSQDNLQISSSRSENYQTVADEIDIFSLSPHFVNDANDIKSSLSTSNQSNTGVRDGRFIDVNEDPLIIDWLSSPAPNYPEPTTINLNDRYDCQSELLYSSSEVIGTVSKMQYDIQVDTSPPDLFGDFIKSSQKELHGVNLPDLLGGNILDTQGNSEDIDSSDMKWFSAQETFHSQNFQSPHNYTGRNESTPVVSHSEVESVFPGFDNLL